MALAITQWQPWVPARSAWPMRHPELAVFCWSAAMLAVFAPLGVQLYRRKALS